MQRRPRIYTKNLLIRLSPDDLEVLDARRGEENRSAYIRRLIRAPTSIEQILPKEQPMKEQPMSQRHRHRAIHEASLDTWMKGALVKGRVCGDCGEVL